MEITEADVNRPLAELVESSKEKIVIENIGDYHDIFYSIESTVLEVWQKKPALKDKSVISAYKKLSKDFDRHKKGSLEYNISISLKSQLIYNSFKENKRYTYGEIISCLKALIKIAKQHRSPSGIGYLHWTKTFFEGNMPETEKEILEYILKYES